MAQPNNSDMIRLLLCARQVYPPLRSIVPSPQEQALLLLRSVSKKTFFAGVAIGVVSCLARRCFNNQHDKQSMRAPRNNEFNPALIELTPAEEKLFQQVQNQQRRKFKGDLLRSHPLAQNSASLEMFKSLSQSFWALKDCSLTTAAQLLACMSQNIAPALARPYDRVQSSITHEPVPAQISGPDHLLQSDTIASHTIEPHAMPNALAAHHLLNTALIVGQPLPDIHIEDMGALITDGTAHNFTDWSSTQLPKGFPKIIGFLPAKPERRADLQVLGDAIEDENFLPEFFKSYSIVNLAEHPGQSGMLGFANGFLQHGPNNFIQNKALDVIVSGGKERPGIQIIVDKKGISQMTWCLNKNTSYSFLLDENNTVVSGISGRPKPDELRHMFNWIHQRITHLQREKSRQE